MTSTFSDFRFLHFTAALKRKMLLLMKERQWWDKDIKIVRQQSFSSNITPDVTYLRSGCALINIKKFANTELF